ncbi:MAG: hypothetical protein ACREBF_02260 [Candidatus Micrarchaeales archaeon]
MATNPDELLIFKLRGMGKKKPEETIQKPQPKAEVKSAAPVQMPVQKPVVSTPIPVQKPMEAPKVEAKRPILYQAPQKSTVAEEENKIVQKEYEQREIERVFKTQQIANAVQQPSALDVSRKKGGRSADESMAAAAGLTCVNHPWRPAYAICDYCDRPFCYADLVEYGKRFYDLEHIDDVAGREPNTKKPVNSFIKMASLFFIINALALFYSVLPQLSFIFSSLGTTTAATVLGTLTTTYEIPLFNLAVGILSLLAGILVLLAEERGIYLSGMIGTITLVGASYEYLNSYIAILLVVSIIALIDIVLLAYGRVSSTTVSYARDIVAPDIEWPRVETF